MRDPLCHFSFAQDRLAALVSCASLRDVAALSEVSGVADPAPYFIDADHMGPPPAWPQYQVLIPIFLVMRERKPLITAFWANGVFDSVLQYREQYREF